MPGSIQRIPCLRMPVPGRLHTPSSPALSACCGGSSLGRGICARPHSECVGVGAQEDSPAIHYPTHGRGSQGPTCSLDSNHAYFILVQPGPPGQGDGLTELQLRLEKHVSEQRTGYGGEACPREVGGHSVCVCVCVGVARAGRVGKEIPRGSHGACGSVETWAHMGPRVGGGSGWLGHC